MTIYEFKRLHLSKNPKSLIFDRQAMKFFGDVLSNFRVTQYSDSVIELCRRRPVREGLSDSLMFSDDKYKFLGVKKSGKKAIK